jgi:predicted alpha/beta superfamily hydrolase
MKRLTPCLAVAIAVCAASAASAADSTSGRPPAATIAGSEVRSLDSKINDAHYKLIVLLPPDYAKSPGKRYPVLYLMDGDAMSLLAAYALPRMEHTQSIPQLIVVGVGYPGATERGWDYGPLSQTYWKMPANRGAEKFIRVLKEEIVPLIDHQYRSDPSSRGIGGHSLGGLISAYALVHASDTFNHFWISSGSLFWDNDKVLGEAADFMAHHLDPQVRVFADIGGEENSIMLGSVERLEQSFQSAGWSKSAFHLSILEGEIHPTVPSTIFADAMTFLYGDNLPNVRVARARLDALAGTYRTSNGKTFTLRSDDRDLYLDGYMIESGPPTIAKLSAASPDLFYSRSAAMKIRVIDEPGNPPKLHISANGEDPPESDAVRAK